MATNNAVNNSLTGQTGTGNFVGSTSPAITTPSLGTLNDTSNQAMLQFIPSAGGNWVTMENLSTPRIMSAGASSNIGITLKSKGDASINLVTASVAASTFQIYSGTGSQHTTLLKFPTSAATTTVTFPDATGTVAFNSVAYGGTGVTSTTAYAVICGGTTSTAALQSVASVGTAGQVLTSNGAGALPSFQNASGGTDAAFGFLLMGG